MTKSFKKRLHRAIAVVMAVAMLVGTIPADLLGGIASVKAAESMVVNFSDADVQAKIPSSLTEPITIGGFTLSSGMAYDTNNKSIDGFSFTHRLKLNGTGSTTSRNVSFTTTGAAEVLVYAMSGSKGKSRALALADETGYEIATIADDGTAIAKKEYVIDDAGTYYLYSKDSGINIYYIAVTPVAGGSTTDGEEVTEITASIDVSDPDALMTEEDKISLVVRGSEDGEDITKGGDFTLKPKTVYDLTTNNPDIAATIEGESAVKTGTENVNWTVKVENTIVTVTPAITGDELGDYALYAVADKSEYKLENGVAIKLPKNTEFALEVRDAEGAVQKTWLAKVDGAGEFTTKDKGAQALDVVITHVQAIEVTPTITGTGLLGDNKIYLTTSEESHEVVTGQAITLQPMTEYSVVMKTAAGAAVDSLEATVKAKTTYTTGVANEEITVAVSTPRTRTTKYDNFTKANSADGKGNQTVGQILYGTDKTTSGILYVDKGTSSGCSYDGQLRFRPGVVLYLPIQDDTTKITLIMNFSATNAGRPTYIGSTETGYELQMVSGDSSITVPDITDMIVEKDGQKYLPIQSGGDVKANSVTLVEYNPINAVTVSGTVTDADKYGITSINFLNMDEADATPVTAEIDANNNYSVVLKRVDGMTNYAATVSKTGYKIDDTNNADKFVLLGNGATATQNFVAMESPLVDVSGTVTGINDAALKGALGVKLIPDNAAMKPVELDLTRIGNGAYAFPEVTIDLGREYTVELTNADDDEVLATVKIEEGESAEIEIKATAKPVFAVSGKFVTSDDKASDVTKVVFTNMDTPKYTYTAELVEGGYKLNLRAGEYKTSVVSNNYEAYDHVSVSNAAVSNDIYLQGDVDTSAVAYEENIEVGKDKKFTKIADAVEYISRMDRTANQRVNIVLDKDAVYREQLVINTPNITIKGNGATITWYYGVGFSYYSAKLSADGKSAYYDEAFAVDKYYKQAISQNPGHWGATVNLLSGATGFAAEDLTFENSLNRYMTTEELADGADTNVKASMTSRTDENINVRASGEKERACVLYIQADNTEYKNCTLLSAQDTLYTGDADENSYFVNCYIEGNTDYICGDGNPVFDACTLSVYGYTDKVAEKSYIVANKKKASMGYLFDDCKIVRTSDTGLLPAIDTILVRAWDEGTVYWINTEVESADLIRGDAYEDMNGLSKNAHYYEYNTHTPDGVAVDTSARTDVTLLKTAEEVAAVVPAMTAFFGNWAPMYYTGDLKVTVDELNLTMAVPEAMADASTVVTADQPGLVLGEMKWYADDAKEAFTGESFAGETVFTAKLTATLEERYAFAETVTVNVPGATSATATVKDGVATITATFPKTGPEGYYVLDLSKGLKKGVQYDGGLSVMEDMNAKTGSAVTFEDGNSYTTYVQGGANPSPNKGEIPESGAVLVVEAIRDGVLNVAIKSTGGKAIHFVNDAEEDYFEEDEKPNENKLYKLPVEAGNTYYLYGDGTKLVYYNIAIDYRKVERAAWDTVKNPEITHVLVDGESYEGTADGEDGSTDGEDDIKAGSGEIKVRVMGWVDDVDGADAIAVDMINAKGDVVATKTSSKANDKDYPVSVLTFVPTASGEYSFIPRLVREEEDDKIGAESKTVSFVLPMGHAVISSITNKYKAEAETGALEIAWNKVTEAKEYEVIVKQGETVLAEKKVTGTVLTVDKLPFGKVTVSVAAIGKDAKNKSVPSYDTLDMKDVEVTKDNKRTWAFAAYGSGVDLDDLTDDKIEKNGYKENADGSVTLYSLGGKGKVVPGSTDGLAFYYTAIDPKTENFILTADVHVDQWTLSNGQDGFGLMVADTVGKNGDGTAFWNNSYQLFSTKIEYNWDTNTKAITNATAGENGVVKYSMKLGLGWIAKEGTTLTDVAKITAGEQATPTNFSTSSGTLETSAAQKELAAGTYNIVGNATNKDLADEKARNEFLKTVISEITDFKLQIERNNTGYILRYLDTEGKLLGEKIFYDDDANKLTQIDKKNIYVGFVASRNAQITVSNINFTTSNPATDDGPAAKEITYVDPNYQILSAKTANSEKYELVYYGNADGRLTIIDANDNVVANNVPVSANKKYSFRTTLNKGDNKYEIVVTPTKGYSPGENKKMSNYDKATFSHHVEYQEFANEIIYVAPLGKATNAGTKESPVDIYTAVAYAKAGQKIYMLGGTYRLKDVVLIDRGHDGTAEAPIYLMGDPTDTARPVLDFSRQTEATSALTLAGDYWYLKGFDVTESLDAQKGILVAGNYNVLEDVDAYRNGNTGIQLSRYLGSDKYDEWPAYNTILNCTSYLNADAGYEDADGFACKLTTADGNKFVGCIAAYNADDGWDLYAKVQSGSIGAVTIDSCLAFKNGYVVDDDGNEINAGNGNGFKMGGDSMSGYHVIKNSVAFANKAKGIDSNSCPDIQVYNCTSFNNESYNVALYTNTAIKTDYYATGILSMKNNNKVAEQIKPVGTQNLSKIYSDYNYYFDGKKSVNKSGKQASLDWFVSTDVDAAISGATAITRKADGSIDMNGFLELTASAPEKVGARLSSTSAAIVLEKAAEVNVYASTVKTLADVELPKSLTDAGYKWEETVADAPTAVFAGTTTEFIVTADGKEDKAVVVNFIELTGVEVSASADMLTGSGKMVLTATPVVAPAVELKDVQGMDSIAYDFASVDKLKLNLEKDGNAATLTRADNSGQGTAKVKATVTVTADGKKVAKNTTYSFTTRKAFADITYTVDGADVVNGVITVDKGDSFTLKDAKVVYGSTDGEDTGAVKVSVNDNKVVKHEAATNKFTAQDEGTATITLTAKTDKTIAENLIVVVRGDKFKTNVSTITVDKAKTEGAQITALECYGMSLEDGTVSIKSVKKGNTDVTDSFTIENVIGNVYNIATIDVVEEGTGDGEDVINDDLLAKHKKLAKGNYTMVLEWTEDSVGTGDGEDASKAKDTKEFEAITVKVTETKPTAKIKVSKKVNLFYTAGSNSNSGALTVTSKLADATLTVNADDTSAYKLKATKNGYSVVLKAAMADEAKTKSRMLVDVSFDGYKKCYDKVKVPVKIATQNVAPKLVLEVDNKTLYTKLGINDTAMRIWDKTSGTYVTGADVMLANSTMPYGKASYDRANKTFELLEDNGEYTLTTSKTGSAKISVQDADWTKPVILNQKITVSNVIPKATFQKIKLNTNPDYAGMEMASSQIVVKNALDFTVRDLELTATGKAEKLLPFLDYDVEVTEEGLNVLNVSLNKALPTKTNGKCEFNGTYTFKVNYGLNKVKDMPTATVKLTLAPKATITTKQSGSIDLVNRLGSSVTVKPTLKNLNGKVVGVVLDDDASNLFEAEWNSDKGAAVITVKEDIDMKKGGRYKVMPTFIVETNGGDVELEAVRAITITPKQSNVKTTKLTVLETRLSAPQTAATATFAATSPAKAEILAMTQTTLTENFKVDYDELSDTVSVKIIDKAGLKAGKTYKIKVLLDVEGAGVNTKQQSVTLNVKVMK